MSKNTQKQESIFKWEKVNVISVMEAVNEDLRDFDIPKDKFNLSLRGETLFLGNGVKVRTDMNNIGNVVHSLLCVMMAFQDRDKKHTEKLRKLIKECIKEMNEVSY